MTDGACPAVCAPSRAAMGGGAAGAGGGWAPSRPSRQPHACSKPRSAMQSRQPVSGGAACAGAALPPGGGAALLARPRTEHDGAGQVACLALAALCAGSARARAELCDAGVRARAPGLARHGAMGSESAPARWQAMRAAHAVVPVPTLVFMDVLRKPITSGSSLQADRRSAGPQRPVPHRARPRWPRSWAATSRSRPRLCRRSAWRQHSWQPGAPLCPGQAAGGHASLASRARRAGVTLMRPVMLRPYP
jgi:hypothetical protein